MRSHEARVLEVKRRIAAREREKRLRRSKIAMASAVAACIALIVGASIAMPDIAARVRHGDCSGFKTAASIFYGSARIGIHGHRATGLRPWRVRDRTMLPAASDGSAGRAG